MSTPYRFHRLAEQTLKPAIQPGTHLHQKLKVSPISGPPATSWSPSIFPIAMPLKGTKTYETRFVTTKVKRKWMPNYRDFKLPVTLLAGDEGRERGEMSLVDIKLRKSELKSIEEAGGIEAKLLSTPSKYLSSHGKLLRSALFHELYRLRGGDAPYAGVDRFGKHIEDLETTDPQRLASLKARSRPFRINLKEGNERLPEPELKEELPLIEGSPA